MDVHIFATEPDKATEWNHKDWFYKLTKCINGQFVRFGKLYKSRSAASRAAGKLGTVHHWYPF